MKTATQIPFGGDGWSGDVRFYKLSEPVTWEEYDADDQLVTHSANHVIVSSVQNAFASETFAFPANEYGRPITMLELQGSLGIPDAHEEVIANLGYTLQSR